MKGLLKWLTNVNPRLNAALLLRVLAVLLGLLLAAGLLPAPVEALARQLYDWLLSQQLPSHLL